MPSATPANQGVPATGAPRLPERRVHVVYEYADDFRPHASAHLRLLRPLTHPALGAPWHVTIDNAFRGGAVGAVDVVVLDRLWRRDITPRRAERIVERIRRSGARLVYAVDDNLLDLAAERPDWPTPAHIAVLETWLAAADGVLVTTEPLAERYRAHNANVAVIPNAIDERLIGATRLPDTDLATPFGRRPVVVGYMGTATHDADLALVLPALTELCARFPGGVRLEIVGVAGRDDTRRALADLPVRLVAPAGGEQEYPLFMLWFTTSLRWDIAIAPLCDTPFNRGKSDVKLLDYAALGAPGVYSRVPAYAGTVRHLETGYLADNTVDAWVAGLTRLVEDAALRRTLALGAARYLHRERTLAACAPRWVEAIEGLMR